MNSIVTKLRKLHVQLSVVDHKLKINAKEGVITRELLEEIKTHKDYLIDYISKARGNHQFSQIEKAVDKHSYLLSSAQKRLYFLYQFDKTSLAYNSPQIIQLEGFIDIERLNQVFKELLFRHENLRTYFEIADEYPLQKIAKEVPFKIERFHSEKENVDAVIHAFIRPFDLSKAGLIRVGLVELSLNTHILMVDMHHIITDGVTRSILVREFMALYNKEELPPMHLQYKDYSEWQQSTAQQAQIARHREFWLNEFSRELSPLDLPLDFVRPPLKNYEGDVFKFDLDEQESSALRAISEEEGVSMFMVLLSFYNILLGKLAGTEDVIIGSTTAGREHTDLENIMGMFVNTLPLRNYPFGKLKYPDFLQDLKQRTLACFDHQGYPYEELIDELGVRRETNRNPLFDVMFAYHNFEIAELRIPGLTLKPYEGRTKISQFDLTLSAIEKGDRISLAFEYSTAIYGEETIRRMAAYFRRIVAAVIGNRTIRLSEISMLSGDERNHLIYGYNATSAAYAADNVVSLFDHQAKSSPSAIALVYKGGTMSYGMIREKSDLIGSYLRQQYGIRSGDLLGIMLERDEHLIPVILGIMKAGAGYVPIDQSYPDERKHSIVEDSGIKLLITGNVAPLTNIPGSCIVLSLDVLLEAIGSYNVEIALPVLNAGDLAYVIYTSGSTGKPKGVMISQRSLLNYIAWAAEYYVGAAQSSFALYTSISFDLTITSIFTPLVTGNKIFIYEDNDQQDLMTRIFANKAIDVIKLTPSHLKIIREDEQLILPGDQPKKLIVGGENLEARLAKEIYDKFGGRIEIYNEYGPTEATVGCMIHKYDPAEAGAFVSIGNPINNTQIYLLDQFLEPVVPGVKGEIYISGDGVAEGYLLNEALTGERFIKNPFVSGQLMYRTGDLALRHADDRMTFIGRIDGQVKIRGFRIELGEVEAVLCAFSGIKEGVVVVNGHDSDPLLVAYYVSDAAFDVREISAALAAKLPGYMIPSYFVWLPCFPLTINGKLDKKALPDPELQLSGVHAEPLNSMEEKLRKIWAEVLKIEAGKISTNKSFFELGGHSLKATLLVNKIFRELKVEVPLKEIFKYQDISSLGRFIQESKPSEYRLIEKALPKPYYPLSSSQKRLYFLYEFDKNELAYNMPNLIKLDGEPDLDRLNETFRKLIARHESLRTSFEMIDDEPFQKISADCGFEIEHLDTTAEELSSAMEAFIRPFDLGVAPLLRVGLVSPSFLLIDMHHIISDGVSNEILVEEFYQLYQGLELPGVLLQYKDYSEWQQRTEQQAKIEKQGSYWLKQLRGNQQPLKLPYDYPRQLQERDPGAGVSVYLTAEENAVFRRYARQNDISPSMLFYTILSVMLSKLSGQESIIIGLSVAGRRHDDLEHTIGLFVNTLAILSKPERNKKLRDFIQEVKTSTLEAYDHQDYQFDDLVDQLNIKRIPGRNPLFDVMLNTLGQSDAAVDLSEAKTANYLHSPVTKRFDLTMNVKEYKNTFHLQLQYASSLFKSDTAETFLRYFKSVISRLDEYADLCLSEIALISEAESQSVLAAVSGYVSDVVLSKSPVRASWHQERLWFIDKFESGYLYDSGPLYHNIPLELEFSGRLKVALLESGIGQMIREHPILRTHIISIEEQPYQEVSDNFDFRLERKDVAEPLSADAEALAFIRLPFATDGSLFRALLLRTAEEHYRLVLVFHHLIADRYTVSYFRKVLLAHYERAAAGTADVPDLLPALDYRGFSLWQQECLPRLEFDLLSYWREQLGPELKALELPTDRPRAAVHIYQEGSLRLTVDELLREQIGAYAAASGFSAELVLLASFKLLLYKYCGHQEIVVGTVSDPRHGDWLKDVSGPLSNLLVLRSYVDSEKSFAVYLQELSEVYHAAHAHGLMPFDKLVKALAPEKDMSRTALFDVLYQYEQAEDATIECGGIEVLTHAGNRGYGKYDLNLLLCDGREGLEIELVYNAAYFDAHTVDVFVERYLRLTGELLSAGQEPLSSVEMILPEEKKALLGLLDRTGIAYPDQQTITGIFREQVRLQGSRIAIKDGDLELSYEELDRRTEILAAELRSKGVVRDMVVGLLMDRSADTVIGMLSILKAGGAYLPVDIDYPQERIVYLLNDSGSQIVLTVKAHEGLVPENLVHILIDEIEEDIWEGEPLAEQNSPSDLCYVIYTSGTTGNPKGVMVEHRNVVRLLYNEAFQFDFGPEDIWTMFHSHCFDFSVWEIYGALLFGGKVIIIPKQLARDTSAYLELLKREQVTVLNQTPSAFYNLITADLSGATGNDLNLRYVIFGGEALSPERLKVWKRKYPDVKLVNMFGITETTVHVTYKEIGDQEISLQISNIGRPIPTLLVYILDENQKVVPQGVIGELYIGGAGVSRGYLGRPELTATRFIADPYKPGERLYRSGDLGRILANGELEYLGRMDHQVQLRGFRIELAEIAQHLEGHESIRECVVISKDKEDEHYLVAYYLSDSALKVSELRTYLLGKLPEYMVPSYFVHLTSFPLTSNGKLDRKALPDPEIKAGDEYMAPSGAIQEQLAEIWSEVLKVDQEAISVTSNFFELGGHSLRAMILVNKILERFGVEVPLKEVFDRRDIFNLSRFIEDAEQSENLTIPKAQVKEYYPLSVAQKAIYFFHEFDQSTLGYNMPRSVKLEGELDKEKLKNIFNQLLRRHESLRTSFDIINEEPVQKIHDEVLFEIEYFHCEENEIKSITNKIIRHFDLKKAPLFRVGLIETNLLEHFLVVDTHHIIMDGTSWNILIAEFKALYNDEVLPELKLQYRDYVEWQNTELRKKEIAKQNNFWVEEFSDRISKLDLATDFERPLIKSNEGADINFVLDTAQTKRLRLLAEKEGTTMFMLLLSVYNILLGKIANQDDIVVGTPIAGREHAHLQDVVGMFVNALPLRNYPKSELSFKDFLNDVKNKTLSCFENQAYQYQKLIEELKIERDTNRSTLYDVMFMYQNFEGSESSISTLKVTPYHSSHTIAEFDISLTAFEVNDELRLALGYQTTLFRQETIARYVTYFNQIVSAVLNDVNIRISAIEMMPASEISQLLVDFNPGHADCAFHNSIVTLFEEQVKLNGHEPCLVCGNEIFTYNEVNSRANRLANYLLEHHNIKPNQIIGVMFESSEWMLIKILGILKSGAAYLPIDPSYPEERISYMLHDGKVAVLISDDDCNFFQGSVLQLPLLWEEISSCSESNPPLLSGAESLAYVIYTSGSTGKPKGILQKHQTIVNLINHQKMDFDPGIRKMKRVAQFASLGFDVSVQEIFYALLNGYSLYMVSKDIKFSPYDMVEFMEENEINVLFLPTAYLSHLAVTADSMFGQILPQLERIIVAGEALKITAEIAAFFERRKHIILENQYGPSETHVVTSFVVPHENTNEAYFPSIGKPISNTRIYILDDHMKLRPPYTAGELYVSGPGVAQGYLTQDTAEEGPFVVNPYGEGVLYKTGDQAMWKADGSLKFIGRRDEQVKVRGYRIELGEIEKVLLNHKDILQAAVVTKASAEGQQLIAYWVSENGIEAKEIRDYLLGALPNYMVPDFFMRMENLPLNKNGKLDRKSLPDPKIGMGIDFMAPSSETETRLVRIWSEVLKIDAALISTNRSFFEVGGHSLNAITLTNKIDKEFNIKISLRELFIRSSIQSIAEYLENQVCLEPVNDNENIK